MFDRAKLLDINNEIIITIACYNILFHCYSIAVSFHCIVSLEFVKLFSFC